MKTLKDIFKLDLNNNSAVKQFYRILDRYRIGKEDKNDFFEKTKEINKSAGNTLRYFKIKIPRLKPLSEVSVESRISVLNLLGSVYYYNIKSVLILDVYNGKDYLQYNVRPDRIQDTFYQMCVNPTTNFNVAEVYIECYGNKLTKFIQDDTADTGWLTPEIFTIELDELIVEKEITKEEYYQKVYDTTKYPIE